MPRSVLTGSEEDRGYGSVLVLRGVLFVGVCAFVFVGLDMCVRRFFLRQRPVMIGAFTAHAKDYIHHALVLLGCIACAAGVLWCLSFQSSILEFMCLRAFFLWLLLTNMRGKSAHMDTLSAWLGSSLVGWSLLFVPCSVHNPILLCCAGALFLLVPYVDALLYRSSFENRISTSVLLRGGLPVFQAMGAWTWVCAFALNPLFGAAYIMAGSVVSHVLPAARAWRQLLRSFGFLLCALGCAMATLAAFHLSQLTFF